MNNKLTSIENNFEITYGDVLDRFDYHFNLEHNKSILFSGKYGIGKSTFLKFYMDKQEDIVTIKLYPVNYAVSSNENIFELIKVDIIKQLFLNDLLKINEKKNQKSLLDVVKSATKYVKKHPTRIVKYISKSLSKLHPLFEVAEKGADGINALIEDFSKFEEEFERKNEISSGTSLNYLDTKEDEIGSYLEFNLISQIIKSTIESAKDFGKKVVLVIDDLDRLDPEHIFRILNIFSSHHDHETQNHKFGFDKVIMVCDLDNIQNIFQHKYGANVDFEGYIDKFYSNEIFRFNNRDAVESYIYSLSLNMNSNDLILFLEILCCFVNYNLISLRQLLKFKYFEPLEDFLFDTIDITELYTYQFRGENLYRNIDSNKIKFNSNQVSSIKFVNYLSMIFGSLDTFKLKLNEILKFENLLSHQRIETMHIKSLVIANQYFSDETKYKLFFKQIKDKNNPNNSFSNPIYDLSNGSQVELSLKWDMFDKYTSEQDYFMGSNLIINDNNREIGMDSIFKMLRQITNRIIFHPSFENLKVISCK